MSYYYLYLKSWLKGEEGQDLAEYALLIGLIALVAAAAVTVVGVGVTDTMNAIATAITSWGV